MRGHRLERVLSRPLRRAEHARMWPRLQHRIPLPERRRWRWPRGKQSGTQTRRPAVDPLQRPLTPEELRAFLRPLTRPCHRDRTQQQARTLAAAALVVGLDIGTRALARLTLQDLPRLQAPGWTWTLLASYLAHPDRPASPHLLVTESGRPCHRRDLDLPLARLALATGIRAGIRCLRMTGRAHRKRPRHLRPGNAADRVILATLAACAG